VARRCGVCGLETHAAVCPRCNTILLPDQAICPRCGKLFSGWVALCDLCGAEMGPRPSSPADEEAVRLLTAVPGIAEERARELVARGFREFADLVRLALPQRAVEKGLHHVIARRVLLADLATKPERRGPMTRCPICGAPWPPYADRCDTCGTSPGPAPDAVGRKLLEVTEEIVDLAQDEDFRGMPDDVREEVLRAFSGFDEDALLYDECRRQIEAWREKGFDVAEVERLLEEGLPAFRERSVRLIRAQVRKKAVGGRYLCPLCEIPLPATAEACDNCGARFA